MVTLPSASVVSCRILWSLLPGPTATRMLLSASTGLEPPLAIPSTVTVRSAHTGDEAAARTTAEASERKANVNGLAKSVQLNRALLNIVFKLQEQFPKMLGCSGSYSSSKALPVDDRYRRHNCLLDVDRHRLRQ